MITFAAGWKDFFNLRECDSHHGHTVTSVKEYTYKDYGVGVREVEVVHPDGTVTMVWAVSEAPAAGKGKKPAPADPAYVDVTYKAAADGTVDPDVRDAAREEVRALFEKQFKLKDDEPKPEKTLRIK